MNVGLDYIKIHITEWQINELLPPVIYRILSLLCQGCTCSLPYSIMEHKNGQCFLLIVFVLFVEATS